MRKLMGLVALAAAMVLGQGCAQSQDCMILANGGNKVCGDDAKAWCDTTDSIRTSGMKAATLVGDPSTASTLRSTQADCDTLRGR